MPYGTKHAMKAGDFGFGDYFGLTVAGSAGIVAALFADFQQKGEASALFVINKWVVMFTSMLGFGSVPLGLVVIGLIVLGGASIFYFQPVTRAGAFSQGFALLAALMTVAPADLAGGIEDTHIEDTLAPVDPSVFDEVRYDGTPSALRHAGLSAGMLVPAAYRPGQAQLVQVRQSQRFDVMIEVTFPEGLKEDIDTMIRRGTLRGRLYNEGTGTRFNLFRTAGGSITMRDSNTLVILAGVPAGASSEQLWVRIEADGYAIQVDSQTATVGQPLRWSVTMSPSSTPLQMQRLGQSYSW